MSRENDVNNREFLAAQVMFLVKVIAIVLAMIVPTAAQDTTIETISLQELAAFEQLLNMQNREVSFADYWQNDIGILVSAAPEFGKSSHRAVEMIVRSNATCGARLMDVDSLGDSDLLILIEVGQQPEFAVRSKLALTLSRFKGTEIQGLLDTEAIVARILADLKLRGRAVFEYSVAVSTTGGPERVKYVFWSADEAKHTQFPSRNSFSQYILLTAVLPEIETSVPFDDRKFKYFWKPTDVETIVSDEVEANEALCRATFAAKLLCDGGTYDTSDLAARLNGAISVCSNK